MSDAALFRAVHRALDGDRWYKAASIRRGVNHKTVIRWDDETNPIPSTIWPEVLADIETRQAELERLAKQVRALIRRR